MVMVRLYVTGSTIGVRASRKFNALSRRFFYRCRLLSGLERMFFNNRKGKKRRRKGQGITEYASIIAFVAILAALVFAYAPGKLAPALSSAFSQVGETLNNVSNEAVSSS